MFVLCVGMYRACSTWQYGVLADLLERHRGARRLGYVTPARFAELDRSGVAASPDAWAILKSHDADPRFLPALRGGRAVAIYAERDLRDVAYSLAHKRGTTVSGIVRQGMLHQVLANDRSWRAQPDDRRITQRYETLVADPVGGVRELATFLDLELAEGEAEAVAAEHSPEANRRRTRAMARRLAERGVDLADPANAQRCDGRSLLHWNHLRTGASGDWRGRATPAERALLARFAAPWLIARGYEADASWAGPRPGPLARLAIEAEVARSRLAFEAARLSRRHPGAATLARCLLGRPDPAGAVAEEDGPATGSRMPTTAA